MTLKKIACFIPKLIVIIVIAGIVWDAIISKELLINRIEMGMSSLQTIQIVGKPPKYEQQAFSACVEPVVTHPDDHWTGDCDTLRSSGATSFMIWKFGIDTFLVVGFDPSGKVVFRGYGDS